MKEVLCDIAPTNSCHLLLRWASLHFKTLNLDERSLYLRHDGHERKFHFKMLNLDERSLYLRHVRHERKLKFMTPRQASKDQHRLKEKIEKERI